MCRTLALAVALGSFAACSGNKLDTAETAAPIPTTTTPEDPGPDPCVEVEIDYDGNDEPEIGDVWTLFMRCDGAVLMGPTVIQLDPTSFATIADNVITFQEAGVGTLFMQTGGYEAELDVTVVE